MGIDYLPLKQNLINEWLLQVKNAPPPPPIRSEF